MFPIVCLGQKFMIQNGDTLPYTQTMEIHDDTLYLGNNTIYPGDTTYSAPCQTFEKLNGQIINLKTADCRPTGFWIIKSEDGLTKKGNYNANGKKEGIWKTYDQNNQLMKEVEYASVANDSYILREIQYVNGQAKVISEKTWFASFYLKNVLLIAIVLGLAFFSRPFINSPIYNRINETDYSPIYFHLGPIVSNNFGHSLQCTFTFWWNIKKLHEKDKTLGRINNVLSVIAIGGFLGLIVGLTISGEL